MLRVATEMETTHMEIGGAFETPYYLADKYINLTFHRPFEFEIRFKFDTKFHSYNILSRWEVGTRQILLRIVDGHLALAYSKDGLQSEEIITKEVLPCGTWLDLLVIYDGQKFDFEVKGILKESHAAFTTINSVCGDPIILGLADKFADSKICLADYRYIRMFS